MSNLKLEVGKSYLTRDGRVVVLHANTEGDDDSSSFPYAGRIPGEGGNDTWTAGGKYFSSDHESCFDLIAEAPAHIAPAVGVSDAEVEAATRAFLGVGPDYDISPCTSLRAASLRVLEQFLSARSTK